MEKAFFTGVYSIKHIDCFPDLQIRGFSGVCYAWQKEDESYIVLPIGADNTPHGNCYFFHARDFTALFQEYSGTIAPGGAVLRPPLRSDSPDLLDVWYEQSLSSWPAAQETDPLRQEESLLEDSLLSTPDDSPAFAALSTDETLFSPLWHPDELLRDREDPPPPGSFHGGRQPVEDEPAIVALSREAEADPVPRARTYDDDEDERESRSALLEQRMRAKFEILLQQMEESANPQVEEQEISRLLDLGSTFTWKQKFMFTEFGLALRRKQKFELAQHSHLRALDLAPNDEHILFNVARAEYELGNADLARQYLDKALSVAPDFTVAKNFQNFLLGRP